MSAYDPTQCFANPIRLVVGPTNLAAAPPTYGNGTPLGYVVKAKLIKNTEWAYADSEARGRSHVQTYRGMVGAKLAFVLAQATDTDVLNKTWAHDTTSARGFQGANRLMLPQVGLNLLPGLVTPDSTLLVAADDPAKPSMLIYAPSWCEPETEELNHVLDNPLEYAFVVEVGLDASNRDLEIDKLENLSL